MLNRRTCSVDSVDAIVSAAQALHVHVAAGAAADHVCGCE
jgi:hypothetical protein